MTGRRDVLVVEDDADLSALMEMVLLDAGFTVRRAADGLEALEQVEAAMPGVILLDMRMPRMNGWEFAREFRRRWDRGAPILVITAAENAKARATEIGAEGWLEKPFDLDDVIAAVSRYVPPAPARPAPGI
ncbi:response regulator [Anaeromyxobacter paludicola]|uniref:Response regulator n=1 Tax=Anaeromyxobacter paludicola TaxID=2918171 RepID=A0ABN6N4R8_9BACT|nr:response regulator [Anaeromyxobacter paludicola]BDG08169.1 response regulator [Anaeromyxobacter paludicola]